MKLRRNAKFKAAALGVAAIATSFALGIAPACSKSEEDKEDEKVVTKIDTQTIKNGNFEFYDDNDGLFPISTPDSWTYGHTGNTSSSMSGVIDTSPKRWEYITDETLPKTLEDNDDLKSGDENKKNYNGALTDDMLYADSHDATKSNATDEDKKYIDNPFTHKYTNKDGKIYEGETEVKTYEDEDGNLYTDEALTNELDTSVLMLHNYRSSNYMGTESYYTSGTTLSLEANTACEISLWVKTVNLVYGGSTAKKTEVTSERGAYIKADTKVGGNTIDSIYIKNINTKQLNPDNQNNGWVQYTLFIEASKFAATDVTLTLGLGEDDVYTVEGYAFFDDVTFKKYLNEDKLKDGNAAFTEKISADNTSYPLSTEFKDVFRADKVTYKTNETDQSSENFGGITDYTLEYNFNDRHFLIDFAHSAAVSEETVEFNNTSVSANLTVDENSFACSNGTVRPLGVGTLDNGADKAFIPNKLRPDGVDLTDDVIATLEIKEKDWVCNLGENYKYNTLLENALKSAASLPGVTGGKTTALVMVSSLGAAYEAEITNANFALKGGEYALVSFWVKTSDMNGKTAATVTVIDDSDKDNTNNFTVDSTTVAAVDIDGEEDIYKGWVKCFARISNTTEDTENAKTFKLKVNFGNTTIKGTTGDSYNAGWIAVANASVMKLDEDVYSYTSGANYTAVLEISEEKTTNTNVFDNEQGEKNEIEKKLATPASYEGVYGASINVPAKDGSKPAQAAGDYDKKNSNAFAGLLNKEHLAEYENNNDAWFSSLKTIANLATGEDIWSKLFGKYSVQPLVIVNTVQTFNEQAARYNYGYKSSSKTVSADGYVAVSVRVKVSKGAVANIYLVEDTPKASGVLNYSLPKYNFWYDDDGNILKGEPEDGVLTEAQRKANIAYTLREDGLYEDASGKLYANLYNLSKYYDISDQHQNFYDASGKQVLFDDLVQGETYYATNAGDKSDNLAPHYLIAGGNGNSKVYKYSAGNGKNATYLYMESGKANANKVVYGIDTEIAKLRYDYTEAPATPYQFTIDARTDEGAAKYADKWITVTFNIHAGSEEKKYRLELWSGARDEKSSYDGATADSFVAFDYSSISLDETAYNNRLSYYTGKIANEYYELIEGKLDSNETNLAKLKEIAAKENKQNTLYNYSASYYTYSLYDSEAFIPFNGETAADDQSGYSYSYSDYDESLALLTVEDMDNLSLSAFIDYSVVDKDIDIIGIPAVDTGSDDSTDTESKTTDSNFWLLMASILLVVAIIIALLAIFIRDFIKKHRKSKTAGKNSYNFNKNKRYVKKYVKANGEAPEVVEDGEVDTSILTDGETQAGDKPDEDAQTADEQEGGEASGQTSEEKPAEKQPTEPTQDGATEEPKDADDGQQKPDDGAQDKD